MSLKKRRIFIKICKLFVKYSEEIEANAELVSDCNI